MQMPKKKREAFFVNSIQTHSKKIKIKIINIIKPLHMAE
jgi:hypothetical protein